MHSHLFIIAMSHFAKDFTYIVLHDFDSSYQTIEYFISFLNFYSDYECKQ